MLCLCLLPACGDSNGDEPDNPNPINPDKEVADPTGTVKLSMRSEAAAGLGRTELDGYLWIDGANNFYDDNAGLIVDIGSVKGLGNIGYIPKSGYAKRVSVTPGHGYVWAKYDGHDQISSVHNPVTKFTYYRIYVIDYVKNAIGEIIGADIKYQRGFNGVEEELKPTEKTTYVNAYSNEAEITFDNNTIIPFSLVYFHSDLSVSVRPSNNNNGPYSAIRIYRNERFEPGYRSSIFIKPLYGKQLEIIIKTKGSEDDE